MTTIQTVTAQQIEQLKSEAGTAGDLEQVALCDAALEYMERGIQAVGARGKSALIKCVAAIIVAEAMQ